MFLEVNDLSVDLGEFHLKEANLSLEKEDYFVLIGPTGSGKSVLLETIAGFYNPLKGQVILDGKDITDINPEKRGISIVYQDHILFPHMNVEENIAYGLKKNIKDPDLVKEKVLSIAKTLKIDHLLHRNPKTLSGGESQRTALARALVVEPSILLMDEPFSALDVRTQSSLTTLIKRVVKKYKTTCIHVTHNFNDVWNLAERVAVMKDGIILQQGRVKEVFSKPTHNFVAHFVGVHNIFEGQIVERKHSSITIKLNSDLLVYSADEEHLHDYKDSKTHYKILVAIRPENIIFSNETFQSSIRNQIKGIVKEIMEIGPTAWIEVDVCGIIFKGILTPSSLEILNIKKDKEIYLSFKSVNVKIIDSCDSFNAFDI
ncbi:ATP-binding cassette domain-containing protein [Methanobacterium alcaliphilum]|uniref:ATP-binding cassette domain-containing protein n=1 Tax=Methanobacterium alcaliphilum TaxID=392018 RepID=UPI00200A16CB|nr:ATP-binding cassette domain-containing protein [Methanobacterium alcaliphilum]MCK9151962.1 ATP-binding cassette domain-containing protein [Methanobacterium alcaliphilum]